MFIFSLFDGKICHLNCPIQVLGYAWFLKEKITRKNGTCKRSNIKIFSYLVIYKNASRIFMIILEIMVSGLKICIYLNPIFAKGNDK